MGCALAQINARGGRISASGRHAEPASLLATVEYRASALPTKHGSSRCVGAHMDRARMAPQTAWTKQHYHKDSRSARLRLVLCCTHLLNHGSMQSYCEVVKAEVRNVRLATRAGTTASGCQHQVCQSRAIQVIPPVSVSRCQRLVKQQSRMRCCCPSL